MLLSDRTTGLVVAAIGGAAAYAGAQLPPVPGQQVGPSALPVVVGIGLVLCGLLVALGVGHSFEEEAETEPAAAGGAAGSGGRFGGLRALLPPGLLVGYALLVDRLGFVPTAALMIAALSRAFGAPWRLALPLAAVAPVVVHLAFYKLLRVPLPPGLLPMPW